MFEKQSWWFGRLCGVRPGSHFQAVRTFLGGNYNESTAVTREMAVTGSTTTTSSKVTSVAND